MFERAAGARVITQFNHFRSINKIGPTSLFEKKKSVFDPYQDVVFGTFVKQSLNNRRKFGHIPEWNTGDSETSPLLYGFGEKNKNRIMMRSLIKSNLHGCNSNIIVLNSYILNHIEPNSDTDNAMRALYLSANESQNPIIRTTDVIEAVQSQFSVALTYISYIPSCNGAMLHFKGYDERDFDLFLLGYVKPTSSAQQSYTKTNREGHDEEFRIDIDRGAIEYPHQDDKNMIETMLRTQFIYVNIGFIPTEKNRASM